MRLTMKGKNGSLNQFTQKVKNKHGDVIEYPKVNGIRDPNNPKHWRWHYQILESRMNVYIIAFSLSMYSTMSFAFNPQH